MGKRTAASTLQRLNSAVAHAGVTLAGRSRRKGRGLEHGHHSTPRELHQLRCKPSGVSRQGMRLLQSRGGDVHPGATRAVHTKARTPCPRPGHAGCREEIGNHAESFPPLETRPHRMSTITPIHAPLSRVLMSHVVRSNEIMRTTKRRLAF